MRQTTVPPVPTRRRKLRPLYAALVAATLTVPLATGASAAEPAPLLGGDDIVAPSSPAGRSAAIAPLSAPVAPTDQGFNLVAPAMVENYSHYTVALVAEPDEAYDITELRDEIAEAIEVVNSTGYVTLTLADETLDPIEPAGLDGEAPRGTIAVEAEPGNSICGSSTTVLGCARPEFGWYRTDGAWGSDKGRVWIVPPGFETDSVTARQLFVHEFLHVLVLGHYSTEYQGELQVMYEYIHRDGFGAGDLNGLAWLAANRSSAVIGDVQFEALSSDQVRVSGWALDQKASTAIDVSVTVDGTTVSRSTASSTYAGLNAEHGRGDRHGFDLTVPVAPSGQEVCVVGHGLWAHDLDVTLGCTDLGVTVSPTELTMVGYARTAVVDVTTAGDAEWSVASLPEWLSVGGTTNGRLTLRSTQNIGAARTGEVVVRSGDRYATITVTQRADQCGGNEPGDACELTLPTAASVTIDGTIETSGDIDTYAFVPPVSGEWIVNTGSASSGFTPMSRVSATPDGAEQIGTSRRAESGWVNEAELVAGTTYYLVVERYESTGGGGDFTVTVTAPELITVSDTELLMVGYARTAVVTVASQGGAPWTVVSAPEWTRTSGSGMQLTIWTTQNIGAARTGEVVVESGGQQTVITVTQRADQCGGNAAGDECDWALSPDQVTQVAGTLETSGDIDTYRFTAPVDGAWTFTADTASAGFTPQVRVTTEPGDVGPIGAGQATATGWVHTADLVAGQTYYLVVERHQSTGGGGDFTVTAAPPGR